MKGNGSARESGGRKEMRLNVKQRNEKEVKKE